MLLSLLKGALRFLHGRCNLMHLSSIDKLNEADGSAVTWDEVPNPGVNQQGHTHTPEQCKSSLRR